jgi:predicted secreted hydrolase
LVRRRAFLGGLAALAMARGAPAGEVRYAAVTAGQTLLFPRDHGAHPDFRNEWWYLTGWLKTQAGEELGFQVTFFRSRPPFESAAASRFAPTQVYLAHAALADARHGRLRHDQRAARPALGLAGAREETTGCWIDDWKLELRDGAYRTTIAARDFTLELDCTPPGAPLLQGDAGYSRKGPAAGQASYYYSRPHLAVRGGIARGPRSDGVTGSAWLDHEWSSTLMAPEAAGWDWVGINLEGGGSLMAFRMRGRGGAAYFAGGTLALPGAPLRKLGAQDVAFLPLRSWRSPRTGVEYPVAMKLRTGEREWSIEPLFDDQELDARSSTGTIYWEGAARCLREGREAGRGYLELTGYWKPLRL